jgi:hypothetical protein
VNGHPWWEHLVGVIPVALLVLHEIAKLGTFFARLDRATSDIEVLREQVKKLQADVDNAWGKWRGNWK